MVILTPLTHGLFHPIRFKILKYLKNKGAISEDTAISYETIARELGLDPKITVFHLGDLQNYKLLDSLLKKVEVTADAKRVQRCYYLSANFKSILDEAQKMIDSLRILE